MTNDICVTNVTRENLMCAYHKQIQLNKNSQDIRVLENNLGGNLHGLCEAALRIFGDVYTDLLLTSYINIFHIL